MTWKFKFFGSAADFLPNGQHDPDTKHEMRMIHSATRMETREMAGAPSTTARLRDSSAGPLPPTTSSAAVELREKLDAASIRAVDICVSAILLVLLLPVILIAVIVIRLDSPGAAFFRVDRIGFRGRPLRMLKFRKMRNDAAGPNLTTDDDHRFTRVGALLAKLKLDELPQLWHVLRGEMSLVGPRPEDPEFVVMHENVYRTILSVRPGITGLSQIAFAEESRILDDDDPHSHYVGRILPQKVMLDEMYAEQRSLKLNTRILLWTTAAVIMRRQVAVHRGSGRMNLRRRDSGH
jgi:lipopolysaccharide/colanic/teichoic acid biosynthesis glycosyltransferase